MLKPPENGIDPREQGAVALAFVGDGVLDLLVRARLAAHSRAPVGKLHRAAVKMVSAENQAAALPLVEPMLSEAEQAVLRRGRNAHKQSAAKNASPQDYRASTGLEALLGWLYLRGDLERIEALFEPIWQRYVEMTGKSGGGPGRPHSDTEL